MAGAKVFTQWTKFGKLPFGRWLFGKIVGITVPYAASIDAGVGLLVEGRALVRLDDRRAPMRSCSLCSGISYIDEGFFAWRRLASI